MKNIFLTIVLSLSSLGLFSQSLEFITHSTSSNVNEGGVACFGIQATDIDVGTTIYYELVGDITPDDLTAGNQYTNLDTDSLIGSFTIRNVPSGNLHPTLGGGRFPGGGPGQLLVSSPADSRQCLRPVPGGVLPVPVGVSLSLSGTHIEA